ncbi:MAG: S-adenosyl-l-methionine hydroxide adenosyltransferase family protein [Planctomycetota bacterium]
MKFENKTVGLFLLLGTILFWKWTPNTSSFVFTASSPYAVVLQTDFGLKDSAVCSMKGVLFQIDPQLSIVDLTHEIPAYNIWEASFRLNQCIQFWPAGTVFVSVVDPGVGTDRKSVVAKTNQGHYIVTPDNGTLTLIADSVGIQEIREIDLSRHRYPGSEQSYTFYGRDVFAFTAGRLASEKIHFEDVGPSRGTQFEKISYQKASLEEQTLSGTIPVLDPQYGNVWTHIPRTLFSQLKPQIGEFFVVEIFQDQKKIFSGLIPYQNTFGEVPEGQPLLYLNSLLEVSFALNMNNFSQTYHIESGPAWTVRIRRPS